MGAGHQHDTGDAVATAVAAPVARRLHLAVLVAALVAVVAAALTWPGSENEDTFNLGADLFPGVVQEVTDCPPSAVPQGAEDIECISVYAEVLEGDDAGQLVELPPFFQPRQQFAVGDRLVLARIDGEGAPYPYGFSDRDRKGSLLVLTLVFGVAVVLLGRLRGIAALVGLATTVVILGAYTLPALLEGQRALPVAAITVALIAVISLYTSHGFSAMTTVAVLGTLASLALTVGLGVLFIELTELSGFATEESLFIEGVGSVDVRGLLLAGLVIGALGALDDMTVTQASVVFELRAADPRRSARALYASAMRVGRDHVASTVNTLFLAYVGASLPLLLLFAVGRLPIVDVANSEVVATEIVRTLVGSIGLVASVPLTTWLAVLVTRNAPGVVPRTEPGGRPPVRRDGSPPIRPATVVSSDVVTDTTEPADSDGVARASSDIGVEPTPVAPVPNTADPVDVGDDPSDNDPTDSTADETRRSSGPRWSGLRRGIDD